ncbi:hypothetical protein VDGD_06056 [Verticillium dahliae]|nr:hypothetical protein VdG1_02495 [Verticillium dahliae VDG1]RBQ89046.1 hypothetical protein VDGD_06056 [Verticillium dahliae]
MGVGRFLCVALPFILSTASLIFLLIACLGGVSNKDLYMFRVNTTKLEINPADFRDIVSDILSRDVLPEVNVGARQDASDIEGAVGDALTNNITAKALGLDNVYDVALWGYCTTDNKGDRSCTDPQFDWAHKQLNTSFIEGVGDVAGRRVELPSEVEDSLKLFNTVVKWTQVAYIVAFISLALSVIFGIFANCTRVMSCVTFLVAQVASIAVVASAALSTAMSSIVVGAIKGTGRWYGVDAGFDTTFLALVWISAACALGAGFFWMFTICCCAPSHNSRDRKSRNRGSTDAEKLLPGGNSYQPLASPANQGFYNPQQPTSFGEPHATREMAYEPYSHRQ